MMYRPTLPVLALASLVLFACGDTEPPGSEDVSGVDTTDVTEDVAVDVPDVAIDVVEEVTVLPCIAGTQRCALGGIAAYEVCNDDAEWEAFFCEGAEVCFDGECASTVCEPFTVESCNSCRSYVGCNAGGTAQGEWPVPFDRTCEDVDGVPTLIPAVCTPNASRCSAEDPNVVETCGECGQSWGIARDCFGEDETTVCDLGACITQCEFIRKRDTYIGCEYWAIDLDNALVPSGGGTLDADGTPFAVVLSNPSETLAAEVTISMQDGEVYAAVIPPLGLEIARLHYYANGADTVGLPLADLQGTMIGAEAFRIEASLPIVAYQFNPLQNEEVYSNDASLLFPTSSLGTDYWVMTRRQTFDSLKGYVTVAAVLEGETRVTVTLPEYTQENPLITLSGVNVRTSEPIGPMRGGDTREFVLRQYEVLNIETNRPGADLTGTHVTSDRQIAVFGGAEAANAPNDDSCVHRVSQNDWVCEATRRTLNPVPCTNDNGDPDISRCSDYITCCADHIEHQMLPSFAWGRSFNATRSVQRGDEADSWRILASQDNTRVNLIGLPDTWPLIDLLPSPGRREIDLDAGEWVDFQSPVDFEISATGPIMVGQFLQAEFAPFPQSIDAEKEPHVDAGTGDPGFILGVPSEQYRDSYTFLAPDAFEFDYVTITAPVGTTVQLDGEALEPSEFEVFGSGDFAVARRAIADGAHTLTADAPVGLMVHGYDRFVSYGYPGGLDLRDLSGGR